MVSATRSDNLNPWLWKRERVARYKDTAPKAVQSVNTFERAEATETEYVMVPSNAVDKLKGYVPVDRLTAAKILEQAPATQASALLQEKAKATQNSPSALKPLPKNEALLAPIGAICTQNRPNSLIPTVSGDKLEGYEPRYFLKEDGKDDVP
jgi:hypothetical protein